MHELAKLNLDNEMDLIVAHKRSMKLAEIAGFSLVAQTTFATSVSEAARVVLIEGGHSRLMLGVTLREDLGWCITACLSDRRRHQSTGFNEAITNARRLVDDLTVDINDEGTEIRLYCSGSDLKTISTARIAGWQYQFNQEPPASPYDDIKRKNSQLQELAERLQLSEQQYQQVTNSLPLLIFSLTPASQLIYVNQGFIGLTGKTLIELNELGWLSIFHPDDQYLVQRTWEDCVATGMPFQGEWRVYNQKIDEFIWHMVSATPLRDASQRLLHWNGFMADIHTQKIIQQTLRDNEELRYNQDQLTSSQQQLETNIRELNRSNSELSQFAYVASHDLQEPLRKIQAFSGMLADQYAPVLDATAQDLIQRMQVATGRMQDLIRGLLAYSRLNTETPLFRSVPLNQLLADVLGDLETAINDRKAIIQLSDSLPSVRGNLTQLRQLFQNLFSNALKFTPRDRAPLIQLTSTVLTATQLPQLSGAAGNYLAISIQDNGIGFEQKYADRIFSLFQRLHNRKEYVGTGIGLAVCKKIVDNHNGYIGVQSEPGVGSIFCVYLPLSQ
jgi:PAS domain S-box-containing protein